MNYLSNRYLLGPKNVRACVLLCQVSMCLWWSEPDPPTHPLLSGYFRHNLWRAFHQNKPSLRPFPRGGWAFHPPLFSLPLFPFSIPPWRNGHFKTLVLFYCSAFTSSIAPTHKSAAPYTPALFHDSFKASDLPVSALPFLKMSDFILPPRCCRMQMTVCY